MSDTAQRLFTAAQTRSLDARAIDHCDLPGHVLMGRAAAALWSCLRRRWPAPGHLAVLCGTGNNGGDGYLLAALAQKRGLAVTVYTVGDSSRLVGDALLARQQALQSGVRERPWQRACLDGVESPLVVVDAMLGTGLGGPVRDRIAAVIDEVNALGAPVLAVDVPSGLCADTGRILGSAVRATATVTFIGRKRGLYTLDGPDCCGDLHFEDLDVPEAVYAAVPRDESCELLSLPGELAALPPRPSNTHKGRYGRVLVIGGNHGMGGAVAMAAEAALRSGGGLVRVATRASHVAPLLTRLPEVMAHAVANVHDLEPLLADSDLIVLGPGLGRDPWAEQLLRRAHGSGLPAVLDADALTLMEIFSLAWEAPAVLTPHPGEAARLLGCDTDAVQSDRFAAAHALHDRWGGCIVLKGNGSLISGADGTLGLCAMGNPGMASGGMGDVLAGLIGGLMAQGLAPTAAARLGVCAHAAAADIAAADGQRGLLATDLMAPLRRLLG